MKYVKILGLAAVAAMALMSFAASSASATTLDGNGSVLKAGSEIDTSLRGSSKFTNTEGTLTLGTCTAGTLKGTTSNETGTTITGTFTLTWGTKETPCTNTSDPLEGGTLHVEHIAGTSNGTVIGTGFKWTIFVASLNSTCSYTFGTGTNLGTLVSGKPAVLNINSVVQGVSGNAFICPKSMRWIAEYTVTTPGELLVTA